MSRRKSIDTLYKPISSLVGLSAIPRNNGCMENVILLFFYRNWQDMVNQAVLSASNEIRVGYSVFYYLVSN